MGAVSRERNALPNKDCVANNFTAKDAIDNGGAGRAAKGANPSYAPNKNGRFPTVLFYFLLFIKFLFNDFVEIY